MADSRSRRQELVEPEACDNVQPKEGLKELAPREIKFRYRRLDTTIRERAGSSQVPREAQESERYPGLLFFVSFFSSLFLLKM